MSVASAQAAPQTSADSSRRLHHLDAVRAFAMLLGIVLHSALSYFDSAWTVRDGSDTASAVYKWLVLTIHAFRMPLFFLLSGFFTSMLVARRGIDAVVRHRTRRIFLPLVLGAMTIVPLTSLVVSNLNEPTVWDAVIANDPGAISHAVAGGFDPNEYEAEVGTPAHLAALLGHDDALRGLASAGADLTVRNDDGSTPLVVAIWAGQADAADALVATPDGNDELAVAGDWSQLDWFGDGAEVAAQAGRDLGAGSDVGADNRNIERWDSGLHHLWFLWHLFLISLAYLAVARLRRRVGLADRGLPTAITLAVIIIATAALQTTMYGFGPDTSTSLIPAANVVAYDALFFVAGAVIQSAPVAKGRSGIEWFGWGWLAALIVALNAVLPFALATAPGGDWELPLLTAVLQATFVWLMLVAFIGAAAKVLSKPRAWFDESPTARIGCTSRIFPSCSSPRASHATSISRAPLSSSRSTPRSVCDMPPRLWGSETHASVDRRKAAELHLRKTTTGEGMTASPPPALRETEGPV